MNTKAEKKWKEIKAEQEMARRFQPNHPWYGIPPVYHMTFHLYLRWVLASIPLPNAEAEIPDPLSNTYSMEYLKFREHFKRAPYSASDVGAFLEETLGEQLEAAFGRQADANDYDYVTDTLREETRNLPSVPPSVERAYEWLNEKVIALKKPSDNPIKDAEHLAEDELVKNAKSEDVKVNEVSGLLLLSYRQIALFYIYEDKHLDSEVIRELLRDMGRNASSSERQIKEAYNKLHSKNERENTTGKTLTALIKAVEKVSPHLSAKGKLQAEQELQFLKSRKEDGF